MHAAKPGASESGQSLRQKTQGHSQRPSVPQQASERLVYSLDGRLPSTTKLGLVVRDAVRRWFLDTEMEAERGDVVSER